MNDVSTTTVCSVSAMLGGTIGGCSRLMPELSLTSLMEVAIYATISAVAGWLVKKICDRMVRCVRCRSPDCGGLLELLGRLLSLERLRCVLELVQILFRFGRRK